MSHITQRTGTEGPRHDPYSYTEITVQRPGKKTVTVHLGLMQFVQVGASAPVHMSYELLDQTFEALTGLTIKQAERALRRIEQQPYREHRKCGGYEYTSGYPGETFCICKCGAHLDYSFNESAII